MDCKKLNEICLNITDGTHSTVIDDSNGNCYLLSCKNVKEGRINISSSDRKINLSTMLQLRKRTQMSYDDVVLTTVGTIGESSIVTDANPLYEFQRSVAIIKPNSTILLSKYLHYFLMSFQGQHQISSRIKGAAQPCLFLNDLKEIEIPLISIKEQQHIVNTIGTIDDLIEKKQLIISKLNECSTLLYKQYKLTNEFENTISLGFCCEIKTGKLNADASSLNGKYPFFTCSQETLYIDNYAFDNDLIVIAGNGEISVRYYSGKCNAYQRTYMLHPESYFFLFLKECELSIDNLKNNSQGSVIKFITKGMLENISIPVNQNADAINNKIKNIYVMINNLEKQILVLKKNKQSLLRKYF